MVCICLLVFFSGCGEAQQANPPTFKDVPYVKGGGERQSLDIYLPQDYKERKAKLPVVVWIHGGGWAAGDKSNPPGAAAPQLGYAFVSINYRYVTQAAFPAQIVDCKAAIRWLRAHADEYNIDANRIGVWGHSAGGHLAALLGAAGEVKEFDVGENLDCSSRVQAVCDVAGPTDFRLCLDHPEKYGNVAPHLKTLFGEYPKESRALAEKMSPAVHVCQGLPPFLLLYGDKDELIPVEQCTEFAAALRKAGVDCEAIVTPGAGHDAGFASKGDQLFVKLIAFFAGHLKPQQ